MMSLYEQRRSANRLISVGTHLLNLHSVSISLYFEASTNVMYNQLCAYLKGEQDLISALHVCWNANALIKANTSTQTIPLCQLTQ